MEHIDDNYWNNPWNVYLGCVNFMMYKVLYKVFDGSSNEIENNYFYVEESQDIRTEVAKLLSDYNIYDDVDTMYFVDRSIISTGNQFISVVICVERVDLMSDQELCDLYNK